MSIFGRKIRPDQPPETLAEEHYAWINSEEGQKKFTEIFPPEQTLIKIKEGEDAAKREEKEQKWAELEQLKNRLKAVGSYLEQLEHQSELQNNNSLSFIIGYLDRKKTEFEEPDRAFSVVVKRNILHALYILKIIEKEKGSNINFLEILDALEEKIDSVSEELSKLKKK